MQCLRLDIKIILNLMMSEWEISNKETLQFKELGIIYKHIILLIRLCNRIFKHL